MGHVSKVGRLVLDRNLWMAVKITSKHLQVPYLARRSSTPAWRAVPALQWALGRTKGEHIMTTRVLVAATAMLLLAGACASKPDPNSAQAACDSMKDLSTSSATSWYQGRRAAGTSFRQIESTLTEASRKCPNTIKHLMTTIARQMAHDSISSLPTSRGN